MIILAGLLVSAALQQTPAPNDTAQRSRTTVLPVISYSEVTGLQYGATMFRGFRVGNGAATRPSSISLYVAHTAKEYAKAYAQLDRWSADNMTRSRARMEYISYPLPVFGIGPSTPDSAEEWYSSSVTTLQSFVDRAIRPSLFLHGGVRYTRSRLRESEPGGLLDGGHLPGSSRSDVLAASLGVVVDSRDDVGAPRSGTYARFTPAVAAKVLGADAAFRRLTIDARRYQALGTHVLAIQLQYDGLNGRAPFDLMPMIGSDTALRGYPRGRFRDQHAVTTQAEVRTPRWRRFGGVLFVGAGSVAPRFTDLGSTPWFSSAGAGVRYLLSPRYRTIVRADLAVGRSTVGIHLGLGEAF